MVKNKLYIYVFIILLVTLGLGFGSVYFITETESDVIRSNKQYLSEIAYQNTVAINNTIEMNLDRLSVIAHIVGDETELNEEKILRLLGSEAERSAYKRMGFADLNGNAITTDNQRFNIAERDYFIQAVSGKNSISNKLIDITDNSDINVYAVPLYHQSEIVGVIFATCTTELFSDIIKTTLFDGQGYAYIVTQSGEAVVYLKSSYGENAFNNLFEEITVDEQVKQMQQNMLQGVNGTIEYDKPDGTRIAAYCRAEVNNWYVFSAVPKSVISQNTNIIVYRNITFSVVVVIAFLILMLFWAYQQKKTTKRLRYIAYTDELTGYPNYNVFIEKANSALRQSTDKQFVFVMLDVDNFKLVNERLGFETGNKVLKSMAKAIIDTLSAPNEITARVSVDEFIVMYNYTGAENIKITREKFEKRFQELMGPNFHYYIKFPTGRYITDKCEKDVAQIYEKVNYAHRKAKQLNDKNGVCEFFYDENEKMKALRRQDIENRMYAAIENKEFKVFLQPKYLLKNETVVGAEALVRWQNADGSVTSPAEFIALFEQNGFIVNLDFYMFKEVCQIIKGWMESKRKIVPVSVNFSRQHLANSNFVDELVEIAKAYNVPTAFIELELTESVIFENENLILDVLNKAHSAGFLLSMDDFGSGYSSLGLLKNLPVDVIKIDRSFFINNKYKERANNVIEIIILMSKKLNAVTVAEGIEDAYLVNYLREVGCDIVQGYYFAKPMPLNEFELLI